MTRRSVRISTTHVIPDHPVITYDDLKRHLDMIDHVIVPVYSVPDPRQPPVGRVVSGDIIKLGDGEYALDINVELFDPEFIPNYGPPADKRVALLDRPHGKYGIWCDLISPDSETTGLLNEISEILKTRIYSRDRTGSTRISPEFFMVIIGIEELPFGYIADSFSRRLGRKKIRQLAGKLTRIYKIPGNNRPDSLLIFDLDVTDRQQRSLLIEVILTNPSEDDIVSLFFGGLGELDRILPPFYLRRLQPKKIVIQYNNGGFRVLYAIEEHGIPMIPRSVSFTSDR